MREEQMAAYIERAERDGVRLGCVGAGRVRSRRKVRQDPKVVGVSLPEWLVRSLDVKATRRSVTRKDLIDTMLVKAADTRCSFA